MKPDPIEQAIEETGRPPVQVFSPLLDLDDPQVRLDLQLNEGFLEGSLPPVGTALTKDDHLKLGLPLPGTHRYNLAVKRQNQMRQQLKYLSGEAEFGPLSLDDEPDTEREPFDRNKNWCVRAYKDIARKHGIGVSCLVCHFVAWTRLKFQKYRMRAVEWDTLENFARPLECSVSSLQRRIRCAVQAELILARRERRRIRLQVLDRHLFNRKDPENVVYSPRVLLRHLGFYSGTIFAIIHRYSRDAVFDINDEIIEAGQGYATGIDGLAKKLGIKTRAARQHVQDLLDLGLIMATPEGCFIDNKRYRVTEPWVRYDLKDPEGVFDQALRELLEKPPKVRGENDLSAANLTSQAANLTSSTADLTSQAANLTSSPTQMSNTNGSTRIDQTRHKQTLSRPAPGQPVAPAEPRAVGGPVRDGTRLRSGRGKKEDPEVQILLRDHEDHLEALRLQEEASWANQAEEVDHEEDDPAPDPDEHLRESKAGLNLKPDFDAIEPQALPVQDSPAKVPGGANGQEPGDRSSPANPGGEEAAESGDGLSPANAPGGGSGPLRRNPFLWVGPAAQEPVSDWDRQRGDLRKAREEEKAKNDPEFRRKLEARDQYLARLRETGRPE